MKILLSNDDGWDAPGLELLAQVAREFGEVWIVAPQHPQSGISHQLTLERPLQLVEQGDCFFSLDGTPADCARVAISQLDQKFDWVLSGINRGANLGSDVFVSGTVAAAREAFLFGIPSLALSQYHQRPAHLFDWTQTLSLVRSVLNRFLSQPSPAPSLFNVNFPDRSEALDWDEMSLIDCDLDLSPLPFDYSPSDSGLTYAGNYHKRQRVPGKDVDVCFSGNISVSQIH